MAISAKPIAGYDPRAIMNIEDDKARQSVMRQMGVINLDPPLPHSPCLKNVQTGMVFPWNELLAEQRDIMQCCDETGNTDPAAWESKVVKSTGMTNEILTSVAQQQMIVRRDASQMKGEYEHYTPSNKLQDGTKEYEKKDVVPFAKIKELREKLNGTSKQTPVETPKKEKKNEGK